MNLGSLATLSHVTTEGRMESWENEGGDGRERNKQEEKQVLTEG